MATVPSNPAVRCAAALLAALALALAWALPATAQTARPFTPPDPVFFGAQVEVGAAGRVREWLEAGLDPNFVADRIGTGLMIAAWQGDIGMMDLFVSRGADVNRANAAGEQALMHAAWRGHLEAVKWLVARGARINREPMQWTALHYAVFAGRDEVAAWLLSQGADINARSTNGSSVLMMAIYEGHEQLVTQLLARGADRGVKNQNGEAALDWAVRFRRMDIARLVGATPETIAAASRPEAQQAEPPRSEPAPPEVIAQVEQARQPRRPSAAERELDDLGNVRAILASRGMAAAVEKLDRQIAALRTRITRPPAEAPPVATSDAARIADLLAMREALAARGLTDAVAKLDNRIAALRAQRARAQADIPPAALVITGVRQR